MYLFTCSLGVSGSGALAELELEDDEDEEAELRLLSSSRRLWVPLGFQLREERVAIFASGIYFLE